MQSRGDFSTAIWRQTNIIGSLARAVLILEGRKKRVTESPIPGLHRTKVHSARQVIRFEFVGLLIYYFSRFRIPHMSGV